jgi:uncharacterized protein YegL
MNKDLADITVVLDRSGSMASCKDDAEGGLNEFIADQKKEPTKAIFSLVQFDTEYEFVHRGVPIESVEKVSLVPRGSTALLDAVGKAIVETGERLKSMSDDSRPASIVFVIITDGQENASKEYRKSQIKEMIEHQQSKYNWQFTFLGANQDAFEEARGLGISLDMAATYSPKKMKATFAVASRSLRNVRAAAAGGQRKLMHYSREDRKRMQD